MRRPKPDPGELELFRRSVGDVTPIKYDKVQQQPDKPAPEAVQRMADEAAVVKEMADGFFDTEAAETGDELLYKRSGIQDKVFRKLRRDNSPSLRNWTCMDSGYRMPNTACPTSSNNA